MRAAAGGKYHLYRASFTPRKNLADGSGRIRFANRTLAARVGAAQVPVLTDDYAPVDRLLSHVLLDRELSER